MIFSINKQNKLYTECTVFSLLFLYYVHMCVQYLFLYTVYLV